MDLMLQRTAGADCGFWRLFAVGLISALACVHAMVFSAAARADVTGPQIVSFLNSQRAAHGIPAGIVEDDGLSQGCRSHNHYGP